MYNPKSHNAEEFISHQEILDSIKYADANKNNIELIDKILEKAKLGKGLTHKEASVLLACDIEDKNNEIFELAKKLNKTIMETGLFCLHRCICQIIALMVVCIALIMLKISIFLVKNCLKKIFLVKLWLCKIWDIKD